MNHGPKSHDIPPARGMEAQQHTNATLGKPGKVKGYPVQVHDGMRSVNPHTKTHEWGGHGASYDANPANPLNSGPARGKCMTETKPVPGQRSRVNDPLAGGEPGEAHAAAMRNANQLHTNSQTLASRVLFEAGQHSAADDRMALAGRLPDATTEE